MRDGKALELKHADPARAHPSVPVGASYPGDPRERSAINRPGTAQGTQCGRLTLQISRAVKRGLVCLWPGVDPDFARRKRCQDGRHREQRQNVTPEMTHLVIAGRIFALKGCDIALVFVELNAPPVAKVSTASCIGRSLCGLT